MRPPVKYASEPRVVEMQVSGVSTPLTEQELSPPPAPSETLTGNGTRSTGSSWRRYRSFMYICRIVRDLVPAVVMCVAFFSIIAHFIAGILGPNFDPAILYPFQTEMMDKAMWRLTFATDSAHVHVYSSDWTAKDIGWKESAPSDWWCILPIPFSRHYDTYFYEGTDGERIFKPLCKHGTDANGYHGNETHKYSSPVARSFPAGDHVWRCVDWQDNNENWPVTWLGGENAPDYAFCVGTAGSKLHWPPWLPWSLWALICGPVLLDISIICLWLDLGNILDSYESRVSNARRWAYVMCAVFWLFWALVFGIFQSSRGYGALLIFGFMFLVFFVLAISQPGTCLANIALPFIQGLKWMYGVKDADDARAGYDIDSDTALAFFLVKGYGRRINTFKRYVLFGLFMIIVLTMAFVPDIPEMDFFPRQFLAAQATTLTLVAVSISKGLAPSSFEVDYLVHRSGTCHDSSRPLWTLLMQSNVLVEAESCRFLGLQHRVQVQDIISF